VAREPLAVWLDGRQVAVLETRRRRLHLDHTDEARRRWPLGMPLVSVAMPLSERPYGARRAAPFFEGLLPEGEVRRTIAFDLDIGEADTFGLLAALGRDCAGALVLQPASDGPPSCGAESSSVAMRSVLRAITPSFARAPAGPEPGYGSAGSASAVDRVWVAPYRRTDGTTVRGHWRRPGRGRRRTPTSRPSPPG
jgi:HipA-like protein